MGVQRVGVVRFRIERFDCFANPGMLNIGVFAVVWLGLAWDSLTLIVASCNTC